MGAKRVPLGKKLRQRLYDKYNHRCAYCGCEILYKDMQVDHVKPVYLCDDEDANRESNLLPACRMCNFYKSTMSIDLFRERLGEKLIENLRKSFIFRIAEKYKVVKVEENAIAFYFEKLREGLNA